MKLLSLDLEMNQPSGKIIQVGAAVGDTDTNTVLETLSVMVNPYEQLNPYIIDLTAITQEQVDNGVTLRSAYDQLVELQKKHNCFMNPLTWGGGDSIELKNQLIADNPDQYIDWAFGRRWIDVKTVFITYQLANGGKMQGGLAKSMTKLGLAFKGKKHNALDDAVNTFRIYMALLRKLKG
jgi:inhibitor of KinA sporulation pathway (predicted exonuclease)